MIESRNLSARCVERRISSSSERLSENYRTTTTNDIEFLSPNYHVIKWNGMLICVLELKGGWVCFNRIEKLSFIQLNRLLRFTLALKLNCHYQRRLIRDVNYPKMLFSCRILMSWWRRFCLCGTRSQIIFMYDERSWSLSNSPETLFVLWLAHVSNTRRLSAASARERARWYYIYSISFFFLFRD